MPAATCGRLVATAAAAAAVGLLSTGCGLHDYDAESAALAAWVHNHSTGEHFTLYDGVCNVLTGALATPSADGAEDAVAWCELQPECLGVSVEQAVLMFGAESPEDEREGNDRGASEARVMLLHKSRDPEHPGTGTDLFARVVLDAGREGVCVLKTPMVLGKQGSQEQTIIDAGYEVLPSSTELPDGELWDLGGDDVVDGRPSEVIVPLSGDVGAHHAGESPDAEESPTSSSPKRGPHERLPDGPVVVGADGKKSTGKAGDEPVDGPSDSAVGGWLPNGEAASGGSSGPDGPVVSTLQRAASAASPSPDGNLAVPDSNSGIATLEKPGGFGTIDVPLDRAHVVAELPGSEYYEYYIDDRGRRIKRTVKKYRKLLIPVGDRPQALPIPASPQQPAVPVQLRPAGAKPVVVATGPGKRTTVVKRNLHI